MTKNWWAPCLACGLTLVMAILAPNVSAQNTPIQGNSSAGKEKSAACAGCHGPDGNSMVPNFPKLAGQHASYLAKQLGELKDGSRNAPEMAPMALPLSDQDMADLSEYFASQKISANSEPSLPPPPEDSDEPVDEAKNKETMKELLAQGSNLYRNGNVETEVSACIACHGPSGEGNKPAAFPALHSQHADYLIKTLNDFKAGNRNKNPENMMVMITKKMSDEEIKAVSYYISTLK